MIRLAKPHITEKAIQKVTEVLLSGNLVQGENVWQFERRLEQYLNVKHAVVVSSGTAALHLSLLALDIGLGDEVIVPVYTYPATANVVEIVGAAPIFVDINLDDFCIDVTKIEEAITEKTKAIIPVHEFGQSANMNPILQIAEKYGLNIIEDAACALGSEYDGKKTGTFGSFGCFSLHPRKAITTGEGGVIVTDSDLLADKVNALRNHGISTTNNKVDFIYAGLNYRMTDFQAVLGIVQLMELDHLINHSINLAKIYDSELSDIKRITIPKKINGRKAIYQTYHILLDEQVSQTSIILDLKKAGIETNIGAYALNMLNFYRVKYNFSRKAFSNAEIAFKSGLALPIGHHIQKADIKSIKNHLYSLHS